MTEGVALLKALSGDRAVPEIQSASVSVWVDRSIAIYRSALSSGVLPSLKLLAKVLGCLRIHHIPNDDSQEDARGFESYPEPEALLTQMRYPKLCAESCFDKRVIQVGLFQIVIWSQMQFVICL